MSIPAGSSSGKKLRLKGKGLPKSKEEQGDLLVELKVVLPERLSEEEEKLFRSLAERSSFNPR